MNQEPRYEIRTGKFGQYFYDAGDERDMALADVLALLNGAETHVNGVVFRLQTAREQLQKDYAEVAQKLEDMTAERNALAAEIEAERDGNQALRLALKELAPSEEKFRLAERVREERLACEEERQKEIEALRRERDDYKSKYEWMVNKAADEKLDGYRELGAKAAAAESRCDVLSAELASVVAEREALQRLPQDYGAPDGEDLETFIRHLADEKRRRVYYRNIVYDVCNRLDAVLGGKTVCGTVDSPTTQVVERLMHLVVLRNEAMAECHLWRRAIEDALGVEEDTENHDPGWVRSVTREIREAGNRDKQITEAHDALTRAGVADWEPYPEDEEVDEHERCLRTAGRMRSVAERIDILASRSQPHEDPARTAYVVALERAAGAVLSSVNEHIKSALSGATGATEFALALEHLHQATRDRAPDETSVLRDELRATHDEAGRLTEEVEQTDRVRRNLLALMGVDDDTKSWAWIEAEFGRLYKNDAIRFECVSWHKGTKTVLGKTGVDIELSRWRRWARKLTNLDECEDEGMREFLGEVLSDKQAAVDYFHKEMEAANRTLSAERQKAREDREELKATIRHMRDKLARVAELVPPYTESVDGRKIAAVVMEQLPSHDPLAVEIERAAMLKDIDDLLQDRGAWVGGRLDSVKALLNQRDGMRTLLLVLDRWIDDNRQAVHSWVATGKEDER